MGNNMEASNNIFSGIEQICAVFQEIGVQIWLDSGTLLGFVRQGDLIPWDTDIDFGVERTQLEPQKYKIQQALVEQGFLSTSTDSKLQVLLDTASRMPYNISIYDRDLDSYVTKFNMPVVGLKGKMFTAWKYICRPIHSAAFLLLRVYRNACQKGVRIIFLFDIGQALTNGLSTMTKKVRYALNRDEVGRLRTRELRIPVRYFDEIETHAIGGIVVPMPYRPDEYLERRYGMDWRTPDKSWKYWEDDGFLVKPLPQDEA